MNWIMATLSTVCSLSACSFLLRTNGKSSLERALHPLPDPQDCLTCPVSSYAPALHSLKSLSGVNTGFGGSADTRTPHVQGLQETVFIHLSYGTLLDPPSNSSFSSDKIISGARRKSKVSKANGVTHHNSPSKALSMSLPNEDQHAANCMPISWVRAAILIRINSLIQGCSGVRPSVVELMQQLLEKDITPRIPVHGSISASGDLSPLSYICGALHGKRNISCAVDTFTSTPLTESAAAALKRRNLAPQPAQAKEALAIVNGTAMSCGVGALVLHDAHNLAVLSEIITAMTVEALQGSPESFDPFFAAVRPHPGQLDASRAIRAFLHDSKLILHTNNISDPGQLKQDRYSIRTAAQWLGPTLEDLLLAHGQLTTEANSVTDNPLIDSTHFSAASSTPPRALHGGNFQARAVTSAMEKTRLALQTIGRMTFTQLTELINPNTSNGLPPNLTPDDPSMSYLFKGIDINAAALTSELGFLANPVGNHVQTAEMGNQALNSLALISARYASTAVDVLSRLLGAALLATCQALDLRVMSLKFGEAAEPLCVGLAKAWLDRAGAPSAPAQSTLAGALHAQATALFASTAKSDPPRRFEHVARCLQPTLLSHTPGSTVALASLRDWTSQTAASLHDSYIDVRASYLARPEPYPYLGRAAARMYRYVREELGVPLLGNDVLMERDVLEAVGGAGGAGVPAGMKRKRGHEGGEDEGEEAGEDTPPTLGMYNTRIYRAIRSGEMYAPAMECLREAMEAHEGV